MGPDKVEKLCQRAQLAIAERDWDKAKQSYLMALGLRSDLPDVHYGLATVYFQLRELTSAAHHFREVTRLDPLRAGAYINLGAVLNLQQQYDEAITALRRGIQLDSQRVEGYYNLGLVYKRKGQLDLAITAYKEAIRINPRMADAHLNLGNLFLEREQPRQALYHYEQALHLRTGWEKALDGIHQAKAAMASETPDTPVQPMPLRAAAPVASDLDRMVDPIIHGAFLSTLHQATIASEETGRLLQKIVGEEVEPVLKELSTVLLHTHGSRGELDNCLTKFETALARMKSAHQALKTAVRKIEELGDRFPTK
jgi:thioredoxin-like negative regulator of GroEL/exonuclease VII small subunit